MFVVESLDSVSELPRSVNQQLQHLSKSRPKRAKTKPPSRSYIRTLEDGVGAGATEDDAVSAVTVDTFFKSGSATPSSATPLISPTSDDRYRYITSILTLYIRVRRTTVIFHCMRSVSSILTDAVTPSQTSPVNPDGGRLDCDHEDANVALKSNHK